ncbi:MAG: hypothetical protein JWM68_5392 [Verrucomicrobiales bacterium]|nr:hypothetical protein [Verrucomicrobiales bacterium]
MSKKAELPENHQRVLRVEQPSLIASRLKYYCGVVSDCVRAKINCNDRLWKDLLEQALKQGREVELINPDDVEDGPYCERMARDFKMVFRIDPSNGYGSFAKERAKPE